MRQPEYILKNGTKIVTHEKLDDTKGMLISPKHLAVRKPNQKGFIVGVVGGHGGDVYWVTHDGVHDGAIEVGAYSFQEFELDESPSA